MAEPGPATSTANDQQPQIEADPEFDDSNDSTLGDDVSKYTTSITSSIERYPIENGRRYHAYKDGSYIMPNDEVELDRLDLTHQMVKICMDNKLYFSPIGTDVERILDIGTGTGIWAIECGDELPNAQIIGTDLSPLQPSWVPANVKFEVDDAEETWTFTEPFDFIHVRYMAAAISDWPRLMQQTFANIKPGGWAEYQDFYLDYYSQDGSLKPEQSISQWITTLLQGVRNFGKDPSPGPSLEGWMKEAGFVNVQTKRYPLPIGPWAKDKHLKTVGSFNLCQIEEGLEAFTLRLFTAVLGWQVEEVQVLLANVRKDLRDPKIHAQFDLWVAWGQKPET